MDEVGVAFVKTIHTRRSDQKLKLSVNSLSRVVVQGKSANPCVYLESTGPTDGKEWPQQVSTKIYGAGVLNDVVANYRSGQRGEGGTFMSPDSSAISESTARRVLDSMQSGSLLECESRQPNSVTARTTTI
eukprot:2528859-Amphidinium_carterae.1